LPNRRVQEIRDMSVEQRERRLSELRTELSKKKTMINAGGSIEGRSSFSRGRSPGYSP